MHIERKKSVAKKQAETNTQENHAITRKRNPVKWKKPPKPTKEPSEKKPPALKPSQRIVSRVSLSGVTVSSEKAIEALHAARGNISRASQLLGCTRNTLYDIIKRDPDVKQAHIDAREQLIDDVEETYIDKAIRGDSYNATFLLRTLGKERGYGYDHKEANLALVSIANFIQNRTQQLVIPDNNSLVSDE